MFAIASNYLPHYFQIHRFMRNEITNSVPDELRYVQNKRKALISKIILKHSFIHVCKNPNPLSISAILIVSMCCTLLH